MTATIATIFGLHWCKYNGIWLTFMCLLMLPDFITSLTNIKINVPRAVKRGGNANLICNYDMEDARLYSIKWYKGKKEFFRFMPNEVPNVKVFPHSNLKVETMLSNQTHLLLQDMQPENSGKYTCEISMDAPDFTTAMITGELEVVELPKEQAIVTGIHPRYRIGDLVDGNCSIKFSKPAANLTWTINGIVVPPHHIKTYQIEKHENSSLESVMSALNFMATTQHFIKGQMRLKCTASLFDIFKEEIESIIEEDRPRIMASGQSYDMHNYPYDQQHTNGDGFEDHNESYLTYYSAADTTSGSASTFTSSTLSIIQEKLKSHFQRIGLKIFALARKQLQLKQQKQHQLTTNDGFAPLRTSTRKMLSLQAVEQQQHQMLMGASSVAVAALGGVHVEHEKILNSKSVLNSLAIVCYCIAAFAIILTHHFMSCQNTKTKNTTTTMTTTTTKITEAMATIASCLSATKSTSMSSIFSSGGSTGSSSSIKSFYNCPEKSVKARKFSLQKLQTSMTLQRQQHQSDCQYHDDDDFNDDNINDDCQQQQKEEKAQKKHQLHQQQEEQLQLSFELNLQLKEHIQIQQQELMLWTLFQQTTFIRSTKSLQQGIGNDNNNKYSYKCLIIILQLEPFSSKSSNSTIVVTRNTLLSLSKDQTLLMMMMAMQQQSLLMQQQLQGQHRRIRLREPEPALTPAPTSTCVAAPLTPCNSSHSSYSLSSPSTLFHRNQRQLEYC